MLSPITILWSMCASTCFMLGLINLFIWYQKKPRHIYLLLSSVMALSAGTGALLELAMLTSESLNIYNELVRWENLIIFMILIPMVWFIYDYFQTGRRWLAISITILWSLSIIVNFTLPGNLTFKHIVELKQLTAFWGEPFNIPIGDINPWKWLADLATVLILLYTADATLLLWRQKHSQRALVVGGSIMIFILSAGIHTPLVDAGLIATPYMVSFWFLAIVFALSYLVVMDSVKAANYKQELQKSRRSLEQISQANLLGEYTTMLAHELNQPLTAVLSNAQAARRYLQSGTAELGEIHAILDDIIRDDKRASEIILRLRSLLQKEKAIRKKFDMNVAVKEVVAMLSKDLREHQIHLNEDYALDLPDVNAGRVEIQQVVLNLLINAAKVLETESEENRTINIRTSLTNGSVVLEIQDSGPGISSEIRHSLFKGFKSSNHNGLGMGLAICYRLIEANGGQVWADNAKKGGAVFSFCLPVAE